MNEKRVYLVKAKCPAGHVVALGVYEGTEEEERLGRENFSRRTVELLRESKPVCCEQCGWPCTEFLLATSARTEFRSLAEALPVLRRRYNNAVLN